jgi:hypothetical protein
LKIDEVMKIDEATIETGNPGLEVQVCGYGKIVWLTRGCWDENVNMAIHVS